MEIKTMLAIVDKKPFPTEMNKIHKKQACWSLSNFAKFRYLFSFICPSVDLKAVLKHDAEVYTLYLCNFSVLKQPNH